MDKNYVLLAVIVVSLCLVLIPAPVTRIVRGWFRKGTAVLFAALHGAGMAALSVIGLLLGKSLENLNRSAIIAVPWAVGMVIGIAVVFLIPFLYDRWILSMGREAALRKAAAQQEKAPENAPAEKAPENES